MEMDLISKTDELGRIVLPLEVRRALGIEEPGSKIKLVCEQDKIILIPIKK